MDHEIWKSVVGYEGAYEVSSFGRVRSLPRSTQRGKTVRRTTEKVLKPCLNGKGYVVYTLSLQGKTRTLDGHRIVSEAFLGPIPEGHHTRHLDGNRANCRLSNLAYGTPAENQADRVLHGTDGRGVKNPQAKLSETAVVEIRRLVKGGVPKVAIARTFGVSPRHVRAVDARRAWRHV